MLYIFMPLLAAHVVGDFLLQPDWMAGANKRKPRNLILHAGIHGLSAYIFCQQWGLFEIFLMVGLSHALIDYVKGRCANNSRSFVVDQLAHVGMSYLIALLVMVWRGGNMESISGYDGMVVLTGLVTAVWGVGHFIRLVADELCDANPGLEGALSNGLKNGGALIGKLERALIFLLVFMGQPGGVGFLIAAKSIIRFEEAKKQPLAEYVLIGTLWSFGLAMAIATLTKFLI